MAELEDYYAAYRAAKLQDEASQTSSGPSLNDYYQAYKNTDAQGNSLDHDPVRTPLGYLLNKAGIHPDELRKNFMAGLLEQPNYEKDRGIMNAAAYYSGAYGPTAVGATLGSLVPGAGTVMGAAAGAGIGKLAQNVTQDVSNVVTPGSAVQKSPLQQGLEPALAAGTQGATSWGMNKIAQAIKSPVANYLSAETGVKPNLAARAVDHIGDVMSSPSVNDAGEVLNNLATKAGIKTGSEGYKLATASLLGKEAATDEMSSATTLKMASLARDAKEALTPQEMYSTAEGLRKAMSAPKYADPHGPLAQNFRLYAQQLSDIEDRLEDIIPGYSKGRSSYADALSKEALSFMGPINKNMSPSQLKTIWGTTLGAGAIEGYRAGTGKSGGVEKLLALGMMSPLLMGKALQGASMAATSQIPQLMGRMGVAAGSDYLSQALAGN